MYFKPMASKSQWSFSWNSWPIKPPRIPRI